MFSARKRDCTDRKAQNRNVWPRPDLPFFSPFPGLQCFSGDFLWLLVYRNVLSIGLGRGSPVNRLPWESPMVEGSRTPLEGCEEGRTMNSSFSGIFAGPIPRITVFSSEAPHAGIIPIHTNSLCSRCRTRLGSPFDPLGPVFDILPAKFSLMWPYKCIRGIRRHRRTETPAVLHSQGFLLAPPPFRLQPMITQCPSLTEDGYKGFPSLSFMVDKVYRAGLRKEGT